MFCWHKWTKWKEYTETGRGQSHPFSSKTVPYTEKRQRRECTKCGLIQDKKVN